MTIVSSGQTVSLGSGTTDNNDIILNGGTEIVSGGTTNNAVVSNGGLLAVFYGGVASSAIVSSGGTEQVTYGGLIAGGTVNGTINIYGGSSATNIAVLSNALALDIGSNASGLDINSGGAMLVTSYGSDLATTVNSAGVLVLLQDAGSTTGTVAAGGYVVALPGVGTGIAGTITSSGVVDYNLAKTQITYAAANVSGRVIGANFVEDVLSASTTSNATITQGGTLSISAGGQSVNAVVSSGGVEAVSIENVIPSTTVADGSVFISGGVASSTSVASGGVVVVSSGGVLSGGSIAAGGYLIVLSGGVAAGSIAGVGETLTAGTYETGLSIAAGGTVLISGGFVDLFDTIASGAVEIVASSGFVGNATILSGGTEILDTGGTAMDLTVDSGAVLIVSSGATLSGSNAASGGYIIALPRSTLASSTAISTGVLELTAADAYLTYNSALITGAVVASLASEYVLPNGIANAGTVSFEGTETIFSGGTANNETVSGLQLVSSGGVASATHILNNGNETVLAGGTASNAQVMSGGVLNIAAGGNGNATVSSDGVALVQSGGTASVTLSSGGHVVVLSGATLSVTGGTAISGGIIEIGPNEAASFANGANITIASNDTGFVQGGASAAAATILAGGTLDVMSGATLNSVTLDYGGTLSVAGSAGIGGITIEVGTIGGFNTLGGSYNVSAILNAELASVPKNTPVTVIFNPGTYSTSGPILLPSNTTLIGNNATLGVATNAYMNGTALVANADAYVTDNGTFTKYNDGTTSYFPFIPDNTSREFVSAPIIDTNISVQGMVFNETYNNLDTSSYVDTDNQTNAFGTWFVDAQNINLQNNVYIGGNDGNAFVNVVNAVAANNIAIGQLVSFDNWDGPVNITIEDNSIFQNSINEASPGSAVQINSTPTNDPANPGSISNVAAIGNLLSGNTTGFTDPINVWPLPGSSVTIMPSMNVDIQGNIASGLETPEYNQYFIDNTQNSVTQDNLASGVVEASTGSSVFGDYSGAGEGAHGGIFGNLVLGDFTTVPNAGTFNDTTTIGNVSDNALLAENTFNNTLITLGSLATGAGNISNAGTTISGIGVQPNIDISAVPDLFTTAGATISLSGSAAPFIIDNDGSNSLSVTLTTQFGTLRETSGLTGVSTGTVNGEAAIIISGSLALVNTDLAGLTYIASASGLDDAIEITTSNSVGNADRRYMPVIINSTGTQTSVLTTIGSSFINSIAIEGTLFPGVTLPAVPILSGEILVASQGSNVLTMGSTVSLAFLGSGKNSVIGGTGDEYISTNTGPSLISLSSTGSITVAGGAGALTVNGGATSTLASDLIQTGAANATVTGGAGAITVAGGVGSLNFTGGSGSTYLATLPEDGGALTATLGTGNSTIFALSGTDSIITQVSTSNILVFGLGGDTVNSSGTVIALGDTLVSSGTDAISGGAGALFITATSHASDNISVSGALSFAGGNSTLAQSIIAGAGALQATLGGGAGSVVAGTGGNTVIGGAGAFTFNGAAAQGAELIAAGSGAAAVTLGGGAGAATVTALGALTLNAGSSTCTAGIVTGSQAAMVTLGGGASTITAGTGGNVVTGGAGALSFIGSSAAGGVNIITAGTGTENVTLGASTSTVTGGTGGSTVTAGATQYLSVGLGSGSYNIGAAGSIQSISAAAASQDTVSGYQTSGPDSVTVTPGIGGTGNVTLNGGSEALTFAASNAALSLDQVAGNATVNLNADSDTTNIHFGPSSTSHLQFICSGLLNSTTIYIGDQGSMTVNGGPSGGYFVGGSAGNNSLIGANNGYIGTGVVTLVGGGNGDTLSAAASAPGGNDLFAGSGNETLLATSTSGANLFDITSASGNDVVSSAGSGTQTFYLGSSVHAATSTITGSSVAAYNIFNLDADSTAAGNYLLNVTAGGKPWYVFLDNAAYTGAGNSSISSISYTGGNGIIQLSDQTTITFVGVTSLATGVGSNGATYIY